jgi:ferredoxin
MATILQPVLWVEVDAARCQGHGRCTALAPELFELDALGDAFVVGDGAVPAELEAKARLAKANCPEFAILLVRD